MVNERKPFIKHMVWRTDIHTYIWYGVVFNSKHDYEILVKADFVNI